MKRNRFEMTATVVQPGKAYELNLTFQMFSGSIYSPNISIQLCGDTYGMWFILFFSTLVLYLLLLD